MITIPFHIAVEEYKRNTGHYSYNAIVSEVGNPDQEPVVILEGEIGDNGAEDDIHLNSLGTYSVALHVTNKAGTVETAFYHFNAILKEEDSGHDDYDFEFPDGLQDYIGGTKVKASDGQIYQCKGWPASGYCQQWSSSATHFEPGTGAHWTMAWNLVD